MLARIHFLAALGFAVALWQVPLNAATMTNLTSPACTTGCADSAACTDTGLPANGCATSHCEANNNSSGCVAGGCATNDCSASGYSDRFQISKWLHGLGSQRASNCDDTGSCDASCTNEINFDTSCASDINHGTNCASDINFDTSCTTESCDSRGYGAANCDCSKWSVYAGAILMRRDNPSDLPLVFNPGTPGQGINAGHFNFDWEPGLETSFRRHDLFHGIDVELRYFGVDSWTDSAAGATTGPFTSFNSSPVTTITGARTLTGDYSSELQNFEANALWCLSDRVTLLAGYRYLELDENLNLLAVDPLAVESDVAYRATTQNRMHGLQIGAEGHVASWDIPSRKSCGSNRLSLDTYVKAGIFANYASQASSATVFDPPPGGPVVAQANGSGNKASFVGDTGIAATYQLRENWALRADYRVLFVEGVALAPDQLPATSVLAGTGFDQSGGVFYHGASLGLEVAF